MVAIFIIVLPAEVGFCDGGFTRSPLVESGVSVGVSSGGSGGRGPFLLPGNYSQRTEESELCYVNLKPAALCILMLSSSKFHL